MSCCSCFYINQKAPGSGDRAGFGLCKALMMFCICLAGTLTVEQIYQDRDQFAKLVRDVAAPDVGRMGIEILSFTIKVG